MSNNTEFWQYSSPSSEHSSGSSVDGNMDRRGREQPVHNPAGAAPNAYNIYGDRNSNLATGDVYNFGFNINERNISIDSQNITPLVTCQPSVTYQPLVTHQPMQTSSQKDHSNIPVVQNPYGGNTEITRSNTDQEISLKQELEKTKQNEKRLENENKSLKESLSENQRLIDQIKGSTEDKVKAIKKLTEEANSLKNRISQIAGAKLTDNNPGIADLSDPNRAIKLGEKFSELYDNEWTDAMEELEPSNGEEGAIKILLDIVCKSYEFCWEKSQMYMRAIQKAFSVFKDMNEAEFSSEISKTMKDYRKLTAPHLIMSLQQEFGTLGYGKKYTTIYNQTDIYQKRCVAVCWFMAVQDPAVYIDSHTPSLFNDDLYKAYTKRGTTVKFLVWPALYLHKDGPLMGKGVAQGTN